jgi:hypothetical protein
VRGRRATEVHRWSGLWEDCVATDLIQYSELVETALRNVVREALLVAAGSGLPGDQHFYITCATGDDGLALPAHLREQYPEDITLVLQHEFWDLEVAAESFDVTLSFNGKNERLHVPFSTVTSFVDPSVEFGLQFQATEEDAAATAAGDAAELPAVADTRDEGAEPEEKIVKLDTFRKS